MSRFTAGQIDVLVATTMVEVGVDVPNATVMVILDADRFGVSQLHQLRGRVGRGSAAGWCLLHTDAAGRQPPRERVEAVAETLDGAELAELDLRERREGDVLGTAQSGRRRSLKLLDLLRDGELHPRRRDEAGAIVEDDPELASPSRAGGGPRTPARRGAGRLPGEGMTRIVGGVAGGRRLAVPPGRDVRPTSERVREALASALEARLGGLGGRTVLDLFAGTGAVGLELLSRGAAAVTLVESDPRGAQGAGGERRCARAWPGATVVAGRAEAVLPRGRDALGRRLPRPAVRPRRSNRCWPLAAAAGGRAAGRRTRQPRSPDPTWPQGFEELHHRRYGDSTLWYGLRS